MAYPVTVSWQENEQPAIARTSDELTQLLQRIAAESDASNPPLVLVANESGVITIGLGAQVSSLNHVPPTSDPPYVISVGDEKGEGVIDFYYFGHHTQFALRNTISNDLAIVAVLDFAESGKLSDKVAWEEV